MKRVLNVFSTSVLAALGLNTGVAGAGQPANQAEPVGPGEALSGRARGRARWFRARSEHCPGAWRRHPGIADATSDGGVEAES
jgi:hypothetical protein